jgi:predicted TIM-barrel fold metal-dependent hydrolase
MKIIDSHIHFREDPFGHFTELAKNAGHENSEAHLRVVFQKYNIERAVVMGNYGTDPAANRYPDIFYYAVGINHMTETELTDPRILENIEENLKRKNCVGVKLYPGYTHEYIYEKHYRGIYELVARYDKAVAIHTGLTANDKGILKYSHPLVVDETAAQYQDTRFVMCHVGYPFLAEMEAVLEKNENVYGDLSGLIEGNFEIGEYVKTDHYFVEEVKKWLAILNRYDKLMYGTDWPLTNMGAYIEFVKYIVPEKYWAAVFYENAKRIYTM